MGSKQGSLESLEIEKIILVTGGLGFLGGRISEYLIKNNKKVRIGTRKKPERIPEALLSCEIVEMDFTDDFSIQKACKNVAVIVHLAALNSSDCDNDPELALLIDSLGTLKLLEAAKRSKVESFLYFSTSHVYGHNLSGLLSERSVSRPVSHYAITHRIAEDYVLKFNNAFLSSCVFRLTNVIGSPLDKSGSSLNLLANDLCKKIAVGQEPVVHSNKFIVRDFISIQNILKSTLFFIDNFIGKSLGGEIINISSSKSLTLEHLSDIIIKRAKKILKYDARIHFKDESAGVNISKFIISNKKAEEYGFNFDSEICDDIDCMLANYRKWSKNTKNHEY